MFNFLIREHEQRKLNLERRIEQTRTYFYKAEFTDSKEFYLEEYHRLQTEHKDRYGTFYLRDGEVLDL